MACFAVPKLLTHFSYSAVIQVKFALKFYTFKHLHTPYQHVTKECVSVHHNIFRNQGTFR